MFGISVFLFLFPPFFRKWIPQNRTGKKKRTRLLASNLLFSARKWRNIKGFRFSLNTSSLFSKFISDLVFGQWPSSSVFISAFLKSQFQKIKSTFFFVFGGWFEYDRTLLFPPIIKRWATTTDFFLQGNRKLNCVTRLVYIDRTATHNAMGHTQKMFWFGCENCRHHANTDLFVRLCRFHHRRRCIIKKTRPCRRRVHHSFRRTSSCWIISLMTMSQHFYCFVFF